MLALKEEKLHLTEINVSYWVVHFECKLYICMEFL